MADQDALGLRHRAAAAMGDAGGGLIIPNANINNNNDENEDPLEEVDEELLNRLFSRIINSGGRFSAHADSALADIRTAAVMRFVLWIIPFVAGLTSNFFIFFGRFGFMIMAMIPVLLSPIVRRKTSSKWVVFYVAAIDLLFAFIPTLVNTLTLGFALWNCVAVGMDCPVGDDSDFERILELPFDVGLFMWSATVLFAYYELFMAYDKTDIERRNNVHIA